MAFIDASSIWQSVEFFFFECGEKGFRYRLPAGSMVPLHKNSTDLISAEHLLVLVKYFSDQDAVFLLAFFKPSIASLIVEDGVIKCIAGNIKSLTERVVTIEQF